MRLQRHPRGFALLELLVSVAIFTIVLGAISMTYWTSHTTFTRGKTKIDIQQQARVALEIMAREIRMAGYDPSAPAVIPLQVTNAAIQPTSSGTQILFIADVDENNASDRVGYRLVGSTLWRDFSSPWPLGGPWPGNASSEVADNVSGLTFAYFNAANGPVDPSIAADLATIRRITIQVTVQDLAGGKTETVRLDTDVRLRNL